MLFCYISKKNTWKYKLKLLYDKDDSKAQKNAWKWKCVILVSTLFETEVKIATKIRREKNENCDEFLFHSISGLIPVDTKMDLNNNGFRQKFSKYHQVSTMVSR